MFLDSAMDLFKEHRYVSPQFKMRFLRLPIGRPGAVYVMEEVRVFYFCFFFIFLYVYFCMYMMCCCFRCIFCFFLFSKPISLKRMFLQKTTTKRWNKPMLVLRNLTSIISYRCCLSKRDCRRWVCVCVFVSQHLSHSPTII
jgi:hypothetical protein